MAYYCLPPIAPKIANRAKKRATGRIPITVQAVFLALLQALVPFESVKLSNGFPPTITVVFAGQVIAVLTLENIRIPINKATAAPMKDRMNPRLSIDCLVLINLFKGVLLCVMLFI